MSWSFDFGYQITFFLCSNSQLAFEIIGILFNRQPLQVGDVEAEEEDKDGGHEDVGGGEAGEGGQGRKALQLLGESVHCMGHVCKRAALSG